MSGGVYELVARPPKRGRVVEVRQDAALPRQNISRRRISGRRIAGRRIAGRRIAVRGAVQGVGFRPWIYRLAEHHGLRGRVWNEPDGVTIEIFGASAALEAFCRVLENEHPPAATVDAVAWQAITVLPAHLPASFEIAASAPGAQARLSIPPDLATCPRCLAEVDDDADRRHAYAFTNCTDCGPRFTIVRGLPYDRPRTTMADFVQCPRCQAEYDDPHDRRFHAQPNACPICGPRLAWLDRDGTVLETDDPLTAAVDALGRGSIVAIKGLGGFHLACDATSPTTVGRLRALKHREAKPFGVMVGDLERAASVACLEPAEIALLTSPARPIVLVRARPGALAPQVAPDLATVGLMLPYTPLHHRLLGAVDRPLVMTSGNRAHAPMIFRDDDAVPVLGPVADRILTHDRPIARRCDDSVARIVADAPMLLRRSRGWVPRPIRLPRPVERPILGCGAHLKNTFCLAADGAAYLGPHIGDLETVDAFDALGEAIADFERLLGIEPELLVHDLHPEYLSTVYARERGLPRLAVQHHHAHLAAAMVEQGLTETTLGLAFDGTGLGADGTSWGGEILLADLQSFERPATMRPLALAGGDVAVREVWRLALAMLHDAYEGKPPIARLGLFEKLPAKRLDSVRRLIAGAVNAPPAHGVGRWFDAFGALILERPRARYEGEVAILLEELANPAEQGAYPFALSRARSPWWIDLRPAVRAVVADLRGGVDRRRLAARVHNTIAAATTGCLDALAEERSDLPERPVVLLTGGCFQNAFLTRRLIALLEPRFDVRLPRQVPVGDGGLALGQVAIGDAHERRSPCV